MVKASGAAVSTRRRFLAGAFTLCGLAVVSDSGEAAAGGPPPTRIVALDWAAAATLVVLGAPPIGVPAPFWYTKIVVAPPLAAGVVDVGLLFTPNFELIQQLRPDLIVIGPGLAPAEPSLRRIAPVMVAALAGPATAAYQRTAQQTRTLAATIGRAAAGETLVERISQDLATCRQQLEPLKRRNVCIASLVDDRHAAVFGPDSLFHDVLGQLGLVDVSDRLVARGEMAIVGLDRLAVLTDARLILVEAPAWPNGNKRLADNPFWRALPFVRAGRLSTIASVSNSGGLPAAQRFARLATSALVSANDVG